MEVVPHAHYEAFRLSRVDLHLDINYCMLDFIRQGDPFVDDREIYSIYVCSMCVCLCTRGIACNFENKWFFHFKNLCELV